MEEEQILRQLDWLDEEHRKDKTRLGSLEERFAAIETNITPLASQIKGLTSEINRISTVIGRIDQFEETLRQQRIESKQNYEDLERQFKKQQDDNEKIRRVEIRAIESTIVELRKELEQIPDLKRQLKARSDEESRLGRLITELQTRIDAVKRSEDEYTRSYRLLEEGRRQDSKRLTDLTGEMTALQKRFDEQRGRVELVTTNLRKIETRMAEINVLENERRDAQNTFMESQALYQAERDRQWKEWQTRFSMIEAQTADIETSLQTMDATTRVIKITQQLIEETAQKVERRINEITEIQRLSEERFRQDWVTFKGDDQKRWVNYILSVDEQKNETNRQIERLAEQITRIGDDLQVVQDMVGLITEGIEKRLQSLLSLSHEWVSTHERSHGRTT
jgi:chromosome segregation ATPase